MISLNMLSASFNFARRRRSAPIRRALRSERAEPSGGTSETGGDDTDADNEVEVEGEGETL